MLDLIIIFYYIIIYNETTNHTKETSHARFFKALLIVIIFIVTWISASYFYIHVLGDAQDYMGGRFVIALIFWVVVGIIYALIDC